MIAARLIPAPERLTSALARKAARLAAAHAAQALAEARDDPARWRQADLLWPLFTKG